jgi:hypothetical protein
MRYRTCFPVGRGAKYWWICLLAALCAACAPRPATVRELPTVMVLPTLLPSSTPAPTTLATITPTPVPVVLLLTDIPTANDTPTNAPTFTPSATITDTPLPSATDLPTITPTGTATATPNADAMITGEDGANLRTGPSVYFDPPLTLLEANTYLDVMAISTNGKWYQVQTPDGQTGWIFADLMTLLREKPDLPVVYVAPPTAPPPLVVVNTGPISIGGGTNNTGSGGVTVLSSGSPPSASFSGRVSQIYQQGLQMGNNPRMFVKVGDSLTAAQDFMIGYGVGQYNLGNYGYLQESIHYFASEAFTRNSIAAAPGFNAAAIHDPVWAPQGICQPNESPLACEYRISKPSIAFIMFGSVDVQLYDAGTFQTYLSQVIQQTTSRGIIPILTTFPNGDSYYPSQADSFNNVIRNLAAQEQIPLIDLRPACHALPNRGVQGDQFHLSSRDGNYIHLGGEESQYGLTLRNLMSLQMLDNLRRHLGMS